MVTGVEMSNFVSQTGMDYNQRYAWVMRFDDKGVIVQVCRRFLRISTSTSTRHANAAICRVADDDAFLYRCAPISTLPWCKRQSIPIRDRSGRKRK